jgi:Cd2+/Zn2+-exporting ATPase
MPEEAPWLQACGETAMVLGDGDRALAAFGLADQPRAQATAAVEELRRAGVDRVVMLTGDNEQVAASVSTQVGITEHRAELLPEDKLTAVQDLDREAGPVAMVGDGINAAPALAAAPVGVAMGAAGTDAAPESADSALMADDLARLAVAVTGARQAVRVMRQNVIASLAVKALFVVLAPLGLVTLVLAVAADMGMSLLVTLNGLRLLHGRHPADTAPSAESPGAPACADGCCTHD